MSRAAARRRAPVLLLLLIATIGLVVALSLTWFTLDLRAYQHAVNAQAEHDAGDGGVLNLLHVMVPSDAPASGWRTLDWPIFALLALAIGGAVARLPAAPLVGLGALLAVGYRVLWPPDLGIAGLPDARVTVHAAAWLGLGCTALLAAAAGWDWWRGRVGRLP